MNRDLRETPLYREVEEHFRRTEEPAIGRISGAADIDVSPDGRTAAFTGWKTEKVGDQAARICTVDLESGAVQEITAGPNNDRMPRWSPDGARLAFLSDREDPGRVRLHMLEVGRLGEAVAAPDTKGTVEYLSWSPDGARILLGVAALGAERAGAAGSGTLKGEPTDLPSWMPTVRSSEPEGWRRLWTYDLESGQVREASREGLNVWEAAWAGPSEIAAVVSEAPGESDWYTAALALLDAESGKERIVYRSERQIGGPAASRSGARLAVIESIASDRGVVAGDVLVVDPTSGDAARQDTGGVDVSFIRWIDEDRLFVVGVRRMDTVAGVVDVSTGAFRELWAGPETAGGGWYPEASPLPDESFVMPFEAYLRPPEIVVISGDQVRTVVSFANPGTDYLAGCLGRIEKVSWTSPDGTEIEGLVAIPDGEAPHPMVVSVHGGPIALYRERWAMASLIAPTLVWRGYAVLLANPRGSTGRGQEFAEVVYGDMGGGDAQDLMAGVDAMIERGIADPDRLGVIGGSYGGFMAAWLVTQTNRFAASVAVSPVTDWYSQHLTSNLGIWNLQVLKDELQRPGGEFLARSPIAHAAKVRTPTLCIAGMRDRCTPPGQAVEFFQALADQGVETALALYPEEGHGVHGYPTAVDFCTRFVGWFERHMPPNRRQASEAEAEPETAPEAKAES